MAAEPRRHRARVLEHRRKEGLIRRDDRIAAVEDVERRRAVVGVDDHLHAVANVVDALPAQHEMARVRKRVGRREPVRDPRQAAVLAHDDVRIGIEGEEGRQRGDAIPDVAAHQQTALRADIVAEGQRRDVAAVEGDERAAQEAAQDDAAGALVRREVVRFPLRIVELLLPRLDVHVGVGELAEINLRPRHLQARDRAFDRHVAEHEHRMSFRREPVHGIHRHAVPVRVDQLGVDPGAGGLRKPLDVQLAGGDHHLPQSCRQSCSDRCRRPETHSRCGWPESAAACPRARASPTGGCSGSSPGCWRGPPLRRRARRETAAPRSDRGRTPCA